MPSPTEQLRQTNGVMKQMLARFAGEDAQPASVSASDLEGFLSELNNAASLIQQTIRPATDRDWQKELSRYTDFLTKLKTLLSDFQTRLQVERVRLDRDANHVQAATAWTAASKGTF